MVYNKIPNEPKSKRMKTNMWCRVERENSANFLTYGKSLLYTIDRTILVILEIAFYLYLTNVNVKLISKNPEEI